MLKLPIQNGREFPAQNMLALPYARVRCTTYSIRDRAAVCGSSLGRPIDSCGERHHPVTFVPSIHGIDFPDSSPSQGCHCQWRLTAEGGPRPHQPALSCRIGSVDISGMQQRSSISMIALLNQTVQDLASSCRGAPTIPVL